MATLSGQKIKDAFASILKLNTNTATTSLKNVESGDGVATALQLSTQKVGINGTQNFVAIPLTDNAEFTGLLIDGNGDIVKRELNAAAFAGATITGATLPLTVSGSNVTVANPSTLTALTTGTVSSGDRFLIYDASTTTWKRIDLADLSVYINPGTYVSPPTIVGRIIPDIVVTTSPVYVAYAAEGSSDQDSIFLGLPILIFDNSSGTRTGVQVLENGTFRVDISLEINTTSANTDITTELLVDGVLYMKATRTNTAIGVNTISFFQCLTLNGGEVIQVRATRGSSGACSITKSSVVTFEKL
tara:strand:- start:62 stop:967 length:906 start_codon:yes stop_codon:yes gene_type:complete